MKDEINEILTKLKNDDFEIDCNDGSAFKEINLSTVETLIDCITNLQEENKKFRKALEDAQQFFNENYYDMHDSNCDKLNKLFDKALGEENESN